ncbi:MAG TPA: putative baseplate assembly protein [Pyrinomonadaceae bacterium]|jgi:uncharacterized phage protein gp47/JayE
MPLTAPNLDDRRFAEIMEEARSLIPRYAPEWTDHNDSDPGITLMQLFSWLGEMILFRLNRVPERNYIKFLQLIGVERKPAAPARVELTFALASPDASTVIIPKGTRVGAQQKQPEPSDMPMLAPEPTEPIVFETDEPLMALGARLSKVQVFDGVNFLDYTEANQPGGKSFPPFGARAREGSALMLGFASNNAFPSVEINLAVLLRQDDATRKEESCATLETRLKPPAVLAWEYWAGGGWRPLRVVRDETRALMRSGHVVLRGPKDAKKAKLGAFSSIADEQLYWLRCRLESSQYEIAPQLDAVVTNTVRATAVTTVREEVVGSSNGQPNQGFLLLNSPVYASAPFPVEERLRARSAARLKPPDEAEREAADKALRERELMKGFLLEVDEGQGFKPWEEVEDFYSSTEEDRHYVLNRTTGEVLFGEHARTPVAGVNNIVARFYRYGGSARGNVGASMVTDLQTNVAGVDSVTNLRAAEGGTDEESIEDTKARAPKELKARDRAVTAEDFEFIALQTPGTRVRRAHALALRHPQFRGVDVPGAMTVVVIPESEDARPMPSESTMQAVCAHLNRRRLLTTEVFVAPPTYAHVRIEATVVASPVADAAKVEMELERALNRYLHPLTGGSDGQGWPLGGDVLFSEVYRVVLQTEGVRSIEDLRIIIDGERFGRCEDAPIEDDALVYSDGHEIRVSFNTQG